MYSNHLKMNYYTHLFSFFPLNVGPVRKKAVFPSSSVCFGPIRSRLSSADHLKHLAKSTGCAKNLAVLCSSC